MQRINLRTPSYALLMTGVMWVLMGMVQSASADTYYVRTSGNDSNPGTAPESAFATPNKASKVMVAGDIVYIGAGEYTSQISPSASGTAEDPIKYIADSNGNKTGDAGQVVIQMTGVPVVYLSGKAYTSFDGFVFRNGRINVQITNGSSNITISNCVIDSSTKYGIEIKKSSATRISDTTILDSDKDGVRLDESGTVVIVDCTITGSKDEGVKAYKALSSVVIERCRIDQNSGYGVEVDDGASAIIVNTLATKNKDGFHVHKSQSYMKIWNCTVDGNKDDGIKAHDKAVVELVNTIVSNNGEDGVYFDSKKNPVTATHHHNISFGNKDDNWNGFTPESSEFSVDPGFIGSGSFQLALGSPARDVGADASSITDHDINGKPRPENSGWDIGCYEGIGKPAVLYVRQNGSDSNDGLSPNRALRTIQHAVSLCTDPGSTVYVGPGEYIEMIQIGAGPGIKAASGTAIAPNTIIADVSGVNTRDDPGVVVISGNGSKSTGVSIVSRVHWTIDGFIVRGQSDYGFKADSAGLSVLNCTIEVPRYYAIYANAEGDITISDCVFDRSAVSGHVIWVSPINRKTPTSVTITRNDATMKGSLYLSTGLSRGWGRWSENGRRGSYYGGSTSRYTYGIIVYGSSRPMVDKITITNNQLSDFYLPIYSTVYSSKNADVVVANNTVTGSFYSIYSYSYRANSVSLTNNIVDSCFYGLLSYARRGKPATVAGILEHNITYNMSGMRRSFEFDVIKGDPMFADPKSGDFSLNGGSPAIDAGVELYVPATDIAGRSRPSDGNNDGIAVVDLGAYELVKESDRVRVVRWREIGSEHNR